MRNALKLIAVIALCEAAGVVGSVFTAPAIESGWYAALAKPAFNPPAWVFGPVWTTLFVLMGIAAFLVWKQHSHILKNVRMLQMWLAAMILFFVQLGLNILWSYFFFGRQSPGGALLEIVILWLVIAATIVAFAKISKAAAWLLAPYLLWVSFAAYLNYSIWMLN